MRAFDSWLWLLLAGCGPGAACAQLQCLPDQEAQEVFAGTARPVRVVWQNAGDTTARAQIYTRLSQTTSATAVPLANRRWRQIDVLPGQTVLETVAMDFPSVTAATPFLIQWLQETNRVLGKTEVLVYPTNLLGELKPLVGGAALGVLDPDNVLKPLLKNFGLELVDLGNTDLGAFSCRLAVIGPFASRAQLQEGLPERIKALAKRNVAVVWLLPPRKKGTHWCLRSAPSWKAPTPWWSSKRNWLPTCRRIRRHK